MADTAVTALKTYADIPSLDWDLLNPEFSSYDLFRKLREETPLAKVQMGMGTLLGPDHPADKKRSACAPAWSTTSSRRKTPASSRPR